MDDFANEKLAHLAHRNLRRTPPVTARGAGMSVERNGGSMISFSSNDYLHLSAHPKVRAAAVAAIQRYGTGSGASYLVTGNHPLYAVLEAQLAAVKGTESACVFGSGYLANGGTIAALAGRDDLILIDELAHASMWAGARASGATTRTFRHNDVADLARLLATERAAHAHALVLTERVFSMDGDRAPLAEIGALARRSDAWLLVDEAHAFGVIADDDDARAVPLRIGTLSKAAGSYGGYLCASRAVVELLKNRARTFVYSTALPPATIAAASAAISIMTGDAALAGRPLALARRFAAKLALPVPASAIVPILIGDATAALAAQARLEARGFLVVAIRPPSVPAGTARLRITFSAAHREDEVDALAHALRENGIC